MCWCGLLWSHKGTVSSAERRVHKLRLGLLERFEGAQQMLHPLGSALLLSVMWPWTATPLHYIILMSGKH